MGYVGLPLAVAFAEAGHDVTGLDVASQRVEAINRGESFIEDITSERLSALADKLHGTTRYADLAHADAVVIAVPTPLTRNREPDLGPLIGSARSLAGVLQKGQLVVLESTTYPGTTRETLVPLLEESGLSAGTDFNVAFSPERVDPGRTDYTLRNTPKVVGGLTPECHRRAVELYSEVCDNIVDVSTPEVAEMEKLLENIFRSVNIALVNELAILCDRMDIDVWEVVEAAATKPYGFMRFEPGPGMGGHCLPVDPFYLAWRAREFDTQTEFVELAGEVNQAMPYFCVDRIARGLNGHAKAVNGSRIAIFGISYKAGVGDLRESPALKIIRLLRDRGGDVVYQDDHVPALTQFDLESLSFDEALDGADVAVIVTAHPGVDWQAVVDRAPLVIDFRGVTRGIRADNLIRL
ncbi:MAG: UDP-N-acetyl-D-glucosamine dehydrogenase [Thermoleophilaceae bacterium]|jgi:UDP-N-acetyl-D-glucosamine dehydrogenase|nr:UDP-N-acetyl-D-glucosamine dehydrogenase [Thermoleophilaceae bacterium]